MKKKRGIFVDVEESGMLTHLADALALERAPREGYHYTIDSLGRVHEGSLLGLRTDGQVKVAVDGTSLKVLQSLDGVVGAACVAIQSDGRATSPVYSNSSEVRERYRGTRIPTRRVIRPVDSTHSYDFSGIDVRMEKVYKAA